MVSRLAGAFVAAAGVVGGLMLEQAVVHRRLVPSDGSVKLGTLRGESVVVTAPDGVRLSVEVDDDHDREPADDLTVIFAHGYALNMNCWHYQREALRSHARLVFADQRSHGKSWRSDREHTTMEQLGLDLGVIIDDVGGRGPIVLVGHSMGGVTIMALAAQRPELFGPDGPVRGVALLATSSGGLAERPFSLPRPLGRLFHHAIPFVVDAGIRNGRIIDAGRTYDNDLGLLLTHRYSFGSQLSPAHIQFTAEMLNATPFEVIAEFLPGLEAHEKREALGVMRDTESLIMVGDRDMLTPQSHSDVIRTALPDARYELLDDTGHMLILERAGEVNRALAELIERVRRGSAGSG